MCGVLPMVCKTSLASMPGASAVAGRGDYGLARGDNPPMPAPLANDTFLRACLSQPTTYTPVWLMRQAGRYLPEYRATRARAGSFMGLATSPDFATEVTLQPLERYPLDAAILFSDILTVPDAMGLGLSFAEGEGPRFAHPLRDEAAVARLEVPDMARLRYVFDAVASIRRALAGKVPLIGFAGSPWTLACYMVEGAGSDDYRLVKTMLYDRPDLLHRILAINAEAVALYLNAQIDAGAQAVMIFDSWGGVLADGAFQTFSLAYTQRVLRQLQARRRRPARAAHRLHQGRRPVARGDRRARAPMSSASTGPSTSARRAGASAPASRCRATSIRPRSSPAPMRSGARSPSVLASFGARRPTDARNGHVFNLGHGISQHAPPESVAVAGRGGARAVAALPRGASVIEFTNAGDRELDAGE